MTKENTNKILSLPVLVAALGYFVDVYDLQLFNLVSKNSLGEKGLHLSAELIKQYDSSLLLWQMGGMLLGGILFGILGDKLGRKSVLFTSILIYSLANIANGFVTDVHQYAAVRLLAGIGLSGELGAAVTLIAEILHKEKRGLGTMLIVSAGALGAVAANLICKHVPWQTSYFIGGGLGLALLFLRVGTFESGMFDKMKNAQVSKGDFLVLFSNFTLFSKYLQCILLGLPVWFVVGILVKFSSQYATNAHVIGTFNLGDAIMYSYIGLSVGDVVSGILSQWFKSRKKVILLYLALTVLVTILYLNSCYISMASYYFLCFSLGFSTGYWALFVSVASEQFGTNIRATVTITVPNFVRGAVIPITFLYKYLQSNNCNLVQATSLVGAICIGLSFISVLMLKETFGKDLDYYETE